MAGIMFMEKEIIPLLNRDLEYLKSLQQKADDDEKLVLQHLGAEYFKQVQSLMNCIKSLSQYHSDRTNDGINAGLRRIGFDSIEMNSLGVAISANKQGTVLVGASKSEDIKWPLELLKSPEFDYAQITRMLDLARISL